MTAILMAFTILTQLSVNRALKRFGWGPVLATGLLSLGAPAILQATSSELPVILLSSAVRGIGFGILTVGGATAIALLVPAARRGAAVGIYGLAVAGHNLYLYHRRLYLNSIWANSWLRCSLPCPYWACTGHIPLAVCSMNTPGRKIRPPHTRSRTANPPSGSSPLSCYRW
ncbi:major facilitator superfamily transporter [Advenella kashmirensis WT001]|uniref:Major facilitator superfamily transporter n=1 Tax=Advenella kashmirensis (strain DSM 17095 / LMG 22695 / WT001) TaxID=1036672 RepID=I3UFH6_ADVKW|nr:major facilitator superfamily transporter [Advenella kashmirensis WT001]